MDGTPIPIRIETGEASTAVQAAPTPTPSWVAPVTAGGVVFLGLTVAALGVLWLRQRPAREPTQDELFEQVADVLRLSKARRAELLSAAAKTGGVPSATGLAMWS
jgi:hypothetical protein